MRRPTSAALCLLLLPSGCATPGLEAKFNARIDHVIVGSPSLEEGIAQIERITGVRPVIGGSHPGHGTRNALMSLGEGTYLELLAPDPAQLVDNQMVRELRTLTQMTPIGWAVSGNSEAELRARLGKAGFRLSASDSGSRQKPDGTVLRWMTFGYEEFDNPLAPFFILWANPPLHPSRTSPGACSLKGVEIDDPSAGEMRRAVEPLGLDVSVKQAAKPRMLIKLRCKGRELALG